MVTAGLESFLAIEMQFQVPEEFNAPRPSWEERMAAGKTGRFEVANAG